MIVHLVLLKIRADVRDDDLQRVFDEIGGLRDKIPGIESFHWGAYSSREGLNRGYTHGFSMTFTDAAARDAYLPHPEHEAVKGSVVEVLDGGIDGILTFDYEA